MTETDEKDLRGLVEALFVAMKTCGIHGAAMVWASKSHINFEIKGDPVMCVSLTAILHQRALQDVFKEPSKPAEPEAAKPEGAK